MSKSDKFIVTQSRTRTLRLLGLSIGMGLVSWYVVAAESILKEWRLASYIANMIGIIGLLFFGVCTALYSGRLLSRQPLVEIDSQGVVDNASSISVGRLAWSEIEEVGITSMARQRFLALRVTDPAAVVRRVSIFKRPLLRLNIKMGWAIANIPESILPISLESVIDEMAKIRRLG